MDLRAVMKRAASELEAKEEYLNGLDAVMGDGEHGSNMKKCFGLLRDRLPEWEERNNLELLESAGMCLLTGGGGTATTLLGLFLRSAAKIGKEEPCETTKDLSAILCRALEAVGKKSQAQPGDKTMMDVLIPSVRSFSEAAERGSTLKEAVCAAARASRKGLHATEQMVARRGRGYYVGERGIGVADPGAASLDLIIQTLAEYF